MIYERNEVYMHCIIVLGRMLFKIMRSVLIRLPQSTVNLHEFSRVKIDQAFAEIIADKYIYI